MQITNCHVHTFTHKHAPARFVPFPLNKLLRIEWFRNAVFAIVRRYDDGRRGKIARLVQILRVSYGKNQADVFTMVRGFYPDGTRFVVLPMDMELMGLGTCDESADVQHDDLARLASAPENKGIVIPFAAADPRRRDVVEKTIDRLEHGFKGIKLYPPMGYHPADHALDDLYQYAEDHQVPILTHCSRPASVQFHGTPTDRMRTDPVSGAKLGGTRYELLELFTSPDAYISVLQEHPKLKLCLAHAGGAGDWESYLNDQWHGGGTGTTESWLAKILNLIRSEKYPNLYTDIAFTAFANDEYLYLLKVLVTDPLVARRVLFGSDFYVVESAELEERHRSIRIRAVLGEQLFRTIAEDNPKEFLGV